MDFRHADPLKAGGIFRCVMSQNRSIIPLIYQSNKSLLEFGRILGRIIPFENSNNKMPGGNFKMWIQFKIGLSLC